MRKYKPMKVFLDGVRLKDVYPHCTKLELVKYRIAKFMRKLVFYIILSITIASIAIGLFLIYFPNRVVVSQITTDTLTPKIENIQNKALKDLKDCERAGYVESDGLITFDPHATNKKVEIPSIGTLQFKKSTVIDYYKRLYNKDITGKEAILIALDDKKAESLARDIIFTTKNGYSNWINCSNSIKMQDTLLVLSKLK